MSDELEHMIEISKCHSIRYATIKKWFLVKYPEVVGFGAKEEENKEESKSEEAAASSENKSNSEEVKNDNVTQFPQPVAQEEVELDDAG